MKPSNVISFLVSGFAFGWLCVITGVWLNQFGRTPAVEKGINSAYALGEQVYNQYLKPDTYAAKNYFWLPERYAKQGAVVHRLSEVSPGYTLLLSAHQQAAELLDISGNSVYRWSFDYSELLKSSALPHKEASSDYFYWWQARVKSSGDILAIVNFDNSTPAGVGMIKLDANSELLWHYNAHVHHDFDEDESGNIYLLEQTIAKEAPKHLSFLAEPYLDEWISILNADGKLQKKINLYEAIYHSPYSKNLRRIHKSVSGDYLHPNAVTYVSEEIAGNTGYLRENSLLIDIRELDAIVALDLRTEQVYWMIRGPWFYQHDPDILENGNILLFDNLSLGKQSRVLEFNPANQSVVWEYRGEENIPLYSAIRGSQQPLMNGNVLIVESNGSRLLEVNRDKQLVWEYYSPVRRSDEGDDTLYAPVFMNAHRYSKEEVPFVKIDQVQLD